MSRANLGGTALPLGGAALLSLILAFVGYRLFGVSGWVGPVHVTIGALIAVAAAMTVVAAARRSASLHLGTAIALLAAQLAIVVTSLADIRLVDVALFPSKRVGVVIAGMLVVAIVGLARRRFWARWVGIALASAGLGSGGLNAMNFWDVTAAVNPQYVAWSLQMFLHAFVFWVSAIGSALVMVNLAAPAVGAAIAARTTASTWTAPSIEARWVRATIIAAMAAVPMLLVYAWLQPVAPSTQPTALALAVVLAIGAVLAIRGKLAGALLLVGAGAGLLVQTVATVAGAPTGAQGPAAYYAVFWVPAGLVALGCGVRLAAPVWRLVRG